MKKTRLLPLLACLFLAPVTLTSCGNGDNQDYGSFYLREAGVYEGTYQVGDPIDTDYFFYVADPSKAEISVAYNVGSERFVDQVTGHTYYPKKATTYVFTCKVGSRSLSKTVRVEDGIPTLNIDDMPLVEVVNKYLYFDDIIAKIAPSYTPVTSSINVERVEFKPLPKNISDEPAYHIIQTNSDGFTAKEIGNYRIYCSIQNGTKYATSVINLVVAGSKTDGNEYVEMGDNGKYLSNNVLINQKQKNIFTLPKARYTEASYVPLAKKFELGDQVAVRFKGKNIPMVGLQMQQSAMGDYTVANANGCYLTFEYNGVDNWNLKSPTLTKGTNWKGSVYDEASRRFEKFGRADLEDEKYYYLSCNLTENVAYTEETTTNPSLWGKYLHCITWSIYEIENYGTPYENIGHPLMDIFHSGWLDEYSLDVGSVVFYSSFYQDITFEVLTVDKNIGNNMIINDGTILNDGTAVLAPALKTSSGNYANDVATGYVGYMGQYGKGTSVAFEFEGANVPDVCLFADEPSSMTGKGKGMLIGQGTEDPSLRGRTTFYAPYRLDCLNKNGHGSGEHGDGGSSYNTLGNNDRILTAHSDYRVTMDSEGHYVPQGIPSPFSRVALDPTKTYLYRVSIDNIMKNASGKFDVSVGLTIYEKKGEEYSFIAFEPLTVKNYDGPTSGNILVYPEIQYPLLFPIMKDYSSMEAFEKDYAAWENKKLARHTTVFKPYAVNSSPLDGKAFESSAEGNIITLNGRMADETAASEPSEDRFRIAYYGIENAMDVGSTLKVRYKGQNIPNMCILADSATGQAVCGGQGFYLATSFVVDSTEATRSKIGSANSQCLTPFGPYRWSDDYGHAGWDTKYRYMDKRCYQLGYGIVEQDENTNYEFSLSIKSLENGVLTLDFSIKNTDTNVTIDSRTGYSFDLTSHLNEGDSLRLGKNLIFYGHGRTVTFSYEIIK